MSDIVERLRWIGSRTSWESADQQCNEAADEIDRLRAEVAALREALRNHAIVTGAWDAERVHCDECNSGWDYDLPERHAPGCLAALREAGL